MDNIIKAILSGGGIFRTAPVYQYNQGMVLEFSGADLPASFVVDLSNSQTGNSIPQTATNGRVTIPDQFFTPGAMIYAWIVLVDESSVVTKYQVMIPVSPRAVRTNDEPTPEQRTALDEAIAALNEAVEDAETAIEHYPQIVDGTWRVWDVSAEEWVDTGIQATGEDGVGISSIAKTGTSGNVDTYTITFTNGQTTTFTVTNGANGDPGRDGVSPAITVSEITGGHRLTITDADHPQGQTVDVMDGTDGDDGRGIVSVEKTGTSGLVDTYQITYTSGDPTTFTVTNGRNGDPGTPGTNAYVWIRYAAAEPTQDSDMKTTPDAWMGVYSGDAATAPTDYTAYTWYKIKGETTTVPVTDVQIAGTSVVSQGVANLPMITSTTPGIPKVEQYSTYGINVRPDGTLQVVTASDAQIKAASSGADRRPITPSNQHQSVFYGLAKASGDTTQSASSNAVGTYTQDAIDKILSMLGIDTLIGPHEKTGLASEAKAIGDPFMYLGKLYKATDAIAQGAAIVPGTNCAETNLIGLIRGM